MTDDQPELPPEKPKTGRPRSDLGNQLNKAIFALETGCSWADVPERYGTKLPLSHDPLRDIEHFWILWSLITDS